MSRGVSCQSKWKKWRLCDAAWRWYYHVTVPDVENVLEGIQKKTTISDWTRVGFAEVLRDVDCPTVEMIWTKTAKQTKVSWIPTRINSRPSGKFRAALKLHLKFSGCTKMVGIRPKVIDMASSDRGLIHLVGNVDKKKLLCNVHNGPSDLVSEYRRKKKITTLKVKKNLLQHLMLLR